LIKELENKMISLEKELFDSRVIVKKENNSKAEYETEINRLKEITKFLVNMQNKNLGEDEIKY